MPHSDDNLHSVDKNSEAILRRGELAPTDPQTVLPPHEDSWRARAAERKPSTATSHIGEKFIRIDQPHSSTGKSPGCTSCPAHSAPSLTRPSGPTESYVPTGGQIEGQTADVYAASGGPVVNTAEASLLPFAARKNADGAECPAVNLAPQGGGGSHPAAATAAILKAVDLHKAFIRGSSRVEVLRGLDLEVFPGEFLAVVGPSGSGKSTLLHLLATLDRPDSGEIFFRQRRIDNLSARGRDRLRNRHFGMVFQMYHLLPELTALENVMLPLMIGHGPLALLTRWRLYRREALRWLEAVGLAHRAHHKPRELSGGEMQRAAIARALVHRPDVLFADEPTGNLDRQTGREILELLRGLNNREKLTIVMVTHDPQVAGSADRIVRLSDGRLYPAETT